MRNLGSESQDYAGTSESFVLHSWTSHFFICKMAVAVGAESP